MRVQTEKQLNFNKHSIHVYESAVRQLKTLLRMKTLLIYLRFEEKVLTTRLFTSLLPSLKKKNGKDTEKVIRFS